MDPRKRGTYGRIVMPVVAFREKSVVLAEQNGWPIISAKGYVDGEVFRKRRKDPPLHAMVGIDDYSEGFRAGYFDHGMQRRSEEHTSELQSLTNLACRLLLEKKKSSTLINC